MMVLLISLRIVERRADVTQIAFKLLVGLVNVPNFLFDATEN